MTKTGKIIVLVIILAICITALAIALLSPYFGVVTVDCQDSCVVFSASYYGYDVTVQYSTIQDIEYVTNLDLGSMEDGYCNNKISAGQWTCDSYDDFDTSYVFCYNSISSYVVITTYDSCIIFNASSVEETVALYSTISLALE